MPFANMGNPDPEQVREQQAILDGIKQSQCQQEAGSSRRFV